MRETKPRVWLVAQPILHWDEIYNYLSDVDGLDWYHQVRSQALPDAEALVELGGRLCYRSWKPGLNANVTRVREDSREYLENILRSKHGSVLEHANFSFIFQDVSRVFTHELVRHRAGVAISQESLRYVRLTDLGLRIPDVLNREDLDVSMTEDGTTSPLSLRNAIVSLVENLEEFQTAAAEAFGLDDEGVPFHIKKEVTSALRRLAPLGLSTSMLWTANVRTLRHVIDMRTAKGAEEEIRYVFHEVARIMTTAFPRLFQDFEPEQVLRYDEAEQYDGVDPVPHWKPKYEKV